MSSKVVGLKEAVALIRDGDAVAATSAGLASYPEYLVKGIEDSFLETGSPGNLTVVAGGGHGVHDKRGDSRFGHTGMIKRIIASHPDTIPPVRKMVEANEIEGYVLPQGIVNQLYRAIGGKQPGVLSQIGMGTYIDPRQDGGKLNAACSEDLVELIQIEGSDWLFYKSFPLNVALIRATTADEWGNLTIEREGVKVEILEVALAARACGGKVIAQVERVAAGGSLPAKNVVVPGGLVDAVVVAEEPEKYHVQTLGQMNNPYMSGELKRPRGAVSKPGETLTPEDVIARRAAFELFPGAVVNVGIGIGAGVGPVADMEGMSGRMTFVLETSPFGGTPTPLPDFGAANNPEAFLPPASMFDFFHGGGLDMTFLGAAQVDCAGNVNVSRFGNRAAGQGGFIDISQTAKKVVFCTFFGAKGFEAKVSGGKLRIKNEGVITKFVDKVDQITFSGELAASNGKEILYVTERAVFKLAKEGLTLTEIAPGVDLQRDILSHMGCKPIVAADLKEMDPRIFTPGRMGCFD